MKKIMTFLRKYYLLILACFMLIIMVISVLSRPASVLVEPDIQSSISPFKDAISGIGVIEPKSKNIEIGSPLSGVVTQIYVTPGQKVKKNDFLFTIDDRDARVRLNAAKAKLESAKVVLEQASHQFELYQNVKDIRAISKDEYIRRQDSVKQNIAYVNQMQAELEIITTEVERLTVKSPIDGVILKISVEPGEYAQAGDLVKPLMIIGNTDVLYIRVEVDETSALNISPRAKAIGFLHGYAKKPINLNFIRFEPLLVSKKSISNKGDEQIDTRVIEILYMFDNKKIGAFVGQQMDVYIQNENKSS